MTDAMYGDKAFTDMLREQIDASAAVVGTWLDKAIVQGAIGGGGGNASHATGSNGHGGLSMRCQSCGKQATRFANWGECTACNMKRCALAEQHDAHVRARAEWPTEPAQPERRFCACGQELSRSAKFWNPRLCGDCLASDNYEKTSATLDARIAAAQPKAVDADPTQAWGAGATPGYDWEGR